MWEASLQRVLNNNLLNPIILSNTPTSINHEFPLGNLKWFYSSSLYLYLKLRTESILILPVCQLKFYAHYPLNSIRVSWIITTRLLRNLAYLIVVLLEMQSRAPIPYKEHKVVLNMCSLNHIAPLQFGCFFNSLHVVWNVFRRHCYGHLFT